VTNLSESQTQWVAAIGHRLVIPANAGIQFQTRPRSGGVSHFRNPFGQCRARPLPGEMD
jgi:hypothetical protein